MVLIPFETETIACCLFQYKMPGTLPAENAKLMAVNDAVIDPSGKFKYILCKVFDGEKPNESKFIVRGTSRAEFHC